jgi:fimbrial isopeptide formation D2 family protein/LPXTG-motif cell wall-anchored protein
MKKLKKILSVVLTLAMVLGMSVTTWAANPGKDNTVGTKDDRGSITLAGIEAKDGIKIALYPVMSATYDEANKNFTGYSNPYNVPMDDNGNYKVDADTLEKIATAVQKDTGVEELEGVTWTSYKNDDTDFGYKSDDTIPVGMYLVAVEGAEAKIYNYAIASVYYQNENGGNVITGGTVDFLSISDANVAVKVSEKPGVTKTIKGETGNVPGNSVNIGDTVNYEVEINPVPYYGGEHPVLNVTDTLSNGLTLNKGNIKVYHTAAKEGNELTEDTDYVLELDDSKPQVLKINFVKNGAYLLNNYAGGKVVIAYSAVLNDKANINQLDNHNEAVLEFTKDSKVDSGQVPGIIERPKDKTYTYTFDIDGTVTGSVTGGIITKFGEEDKDEDGKNDPLNGAVFTLYTQDPTGLTGEALEKVIYKNYTVDESGNKTPLFDGTVTSVDGGQLPIKGLAAGTTKAPATYYLKETTAPSGYSLNTHVFKIQISATYITDDGDNKGKLESWTITIDDNPINTFNVTHEGNNATAPEFNGEGVDIQNTKISSLPSTGGIGTTIFTIGGCAIMILAAGLYFASRRKSAK